MGAECPCRTWAGQVFLLHWRRRSHLPRASDAVRRRRKVGQLPICFLDIRVDSQVVQGKTELGRGGIIIKGHHSARQSTNKSLNPLVGPCRVRIIGLETITRPHFLCSKQQVSGDFDSWWTDAGPHCPSVVLTNRDADEMSQVTFLPSFSLLLTLHQSIFTF